MGLRVVSGYEGSARREDQARVGKDRARPGSISRGTSKPSKPSKPRNALERARDSFDRPKADKPRATEDRR
ncbi:MAG: hypothetical protein Q8S33_01970 [Myxococcales bacterium]|nr:hypothetical protein [Myxococcales bacterium]MDP3499063.1 hypothetical protein [Myxococcales bacterium]